MYYTTPDDPVKRLTLLTGKRSVGNKNIQLRNEVYEILDQLLKLSVIDKQQNDNYIKKNLQQTDE